MTVDLPARSPDASSGQPATTPTPGGVTDPAGHAQTTPLASPPAESVPVADLPTGGLAAAGVPGGLVEATGTPLDGAVAPGEAPAVRVPSLSPSRAGDFKTCPLLYRLRSIDRIPEQPTADQARGTLVHAVLERLFDLPAAERTAEQARSLVMPQWERLVTEEPELAGVLDATETPERFLDSARDLLGGYFAVEDPSRLAPAEREFLVSTEIDLGDERHLVLRGYIDRLDVSPAGDIRVVDYKTGGAPREAFEARALFQLKFYALVLWRTRGVVPRMLRLIYLKDAEVCDYSPDTEELERFERTLVALWAAIEQATAARDFRPKPSRLCGWCSHQALCPAFDGTPPPFPEIIPPPAVLTPATELAGP